MITLHRRLRIIVGIVVICILGIIQISVAQSSSDEASIREALRILRDRFNTKDHLSLVGDVGPIIPTKMVLQDSLLKSSMGESSNPSVGEGTAQKDNQSQAVSSSEEAAELDTLQQISAILGVSKAGPDTGTGLSPEQVETTGSGTSQGTSVTSPSEPTVPSGFSHSGS